MKKFEETPELAWDELVKKAKPFHEQNKKELGEILKKSMESIIKFILSETFTINAKNLC